MENQIPEMPFNEGLLQTDGKTLESLNERSEGLLQPTKKDSDEPKFILNEWNRSIDVIFGVYGPISFFLYNKKVTNRQENLHGKDSTRYESDVGER